MGRFFYKFISCAVLGLTLNVQAGNCANGASDFSRPGSVALQSTGNSYQATASASAYNGSNDSDSGSGTRTIGFTYQSDDDECDAIYTQRKFKWGFHYALSSEADPDFLEPNKGSVKAASAVSVAKNGTLTHTAKVGCAGANNLSLGLSLGSVSVTVSLAFAQSDGDNQYIPFIETDNTQGSHSPRSTITFTTSTTVCASAKADCGWFSEARAVAAAYAYTVDEDEGQYSDSECILFQYQN